MRISVTFILLYGHTVLFFKGIACTYLWLLNKKILKRNRPEKARFGIYRFHWSSDIMSRVCGFPEFHATNVSDFSTTFFDDMLALGHKLKIKAVRH